MRFPHGIENHTADEKDRISVFARCYVIDKKKNRQKPEYEFKAGKNDHSSRVLLPCQLPPALAVPPAVLRPVPEEPPDALLLSVFSD